MNFKNSKIILYIYRHDAAPVILANNMNKEKLLHIPSHIAGPVVPFELAATFPTWTQRPDPSFYSEISSAAISSLAFTEDLIKNYVSTFHRI